VSGLIDRWFFREVDASSLAVFRFLFGGMLLFESVNYGIFLCLDCMYRDTAMLFKYHHFEWAKMLPGIGLELVFLVMGIAAICIMLGWHYRIAMVVYTLTFSYHFLLDQALYLNHFYLVILFCVIMIFVPAHRLWSLDARRRPEIASATVPNWGRFWLAAQLEIVLLYAGFVKLSTQSRRGRLFPMAHPGLGHCIVELWCYRTAHNRCAIATVAQDASGCVLCVCVFSHHQCLCIRYRHIPVDDSSRHSVVF